MAPTNSSQSRSLRGNNKAANPINRAWTEDRIDISSALLGRGQENASTARHNLEEGIKVTRKSDPSSAVQAGTRTRGRQNSLRDVKNSTEVLRQRSLKVPAVDSTAALADPSTAIREGRHFTVANVGNNGKIYLRPSVRPAPPHQPPPPSYPFDGSAHRTGRDSDLESSAEKKRWSDTQASRTTTRRPRAKSTEFQRKRSTSMARQSSRLRSDSMSTLDADYRPDQGAYRVVIGNSKNDNKGKVNGGKAEGLFAAQNITQATKSGPNIDVPIPHYRLGTPRFSTQGTPFLHSAVFSRPSTEDVDSTIMSSREFDSLFAVPYAMDMHEAARHLHDPQSTPPPAAPTPKGTPVPMRKPIITNTAVFHKAREPITPSIYEAIAANPDDPSIVRYAMSTREISAASPARIIAQITSKNFLDYELLSDFFLTVRAYLSTADLLAYLLARFQWAINRLDDDGRVIRVRAFAAIRHWILNYFPYDFVVDRELRVKFCDFLNVLTRQVRSDGHEASDLKLIIDLKKCWNGRCALYWDNLGDDNDSRQDSDIVPGGIVGSRDSQLTHPNELWEKLATTSSHQLDQEKSVAALHNWVDSVIEAEVDGRSKSDRPNPSSTVSPTHPTSMLSEQSIQAMSCTLPGKINKAMPSQSARVAGPHPVQTIPSNAVRRVGATATMGSTTKDKGRGKSEHQRSGSFSDALRDKRTSLGAIQEGKPSEPVVVSYTFAGGLIRGTACPPGSPFIDNPNRHASGPNTSALRPGQYTALPTNKIATARPMSPGVRNLLGTIRRAWGSKQNSSSSTSSLLSAPPFMLEEKHAGLPIHIAYKIEGFGDQHNQLEALKKNARIDLLCADVTDMFEKAVTQGQKRLTDSPREMKSATAVNAGSVHSREPMQPLPDSWQQQIERSEREDFGARKHSAVTTGSRSIVIVDDTSSEPPVPLIPLPYSHNEHNAGSYGPSSTHNAQAVYEEKATPQSELLPSFSLPKSTQLSTASTDAPRAPPSRRSNSISLRRYVSYQSGMRRSGPEYQPTASTQADLVTDASVPQPARMLRRRPGGDLRANQNVHDMEPIARPRSTGSIATYNDSLHNSYGFPRPSGRTTITSNDLTGQEQGDGIATPRQEKTISLAEDPTQKDLRPSFERAVAEFARIPDGEGGDLEATLLKLEGKFRKSPVVTSNGRDKPDQFPSINGSSSQQAAPHDVISRTLEAATVVVTDSTANLSKSVNGRASSKSAESGSKLAALHDMSTRSVYTTSEDSYSSTPLVERDARKIAAASVMTDSTQSNVSVPPPLFSPKPPLSRDPSTMSGETSDMESMARVRRGRCRSSIPTMTTDSFLLDEDEFLSDLSSDMSEDGLTEDLDDHTDSDNDIETDSVLEDAYGTPTRSMQGRTQLPPGVGYASGYLPSPPMTNENALALSSEALRNQEERKPPTPGPSPDGRPFESLKSRTPIQVDESVLQPFANRVHQFPTRRHIPFVLAVDPIVLSEQFALIERDALNEINWQDLIDLRWQQSPPMAQNWVEYIRFQDPNGIDLVTARFNLVVKWVVSEIVLTHNPEERAMTIVKYVRVAQYARRQHNYATLLQLTLALTSMDCTRLTKTWALVPESVRAEMKEMEILVSPLRNFHNLRAEMEAADLDDGCIPVVALFLHDLTYNAQKPSIIASTRDSEPLINFERYRTTATIVKSLLRLIDASAKYDFKPVEGALERCLWLATLSDEGIRNKSREIEP